MVEGVCIAGALKITVSKGEVEVIPLTYYGRYLEFVDLNSISVSYVTTIQSTIL